MPAVGLAAVQQRAAQERELKEARRLDALAKDERVSELVDRVEGSGRFDRIYIGAAASVSAHGVRAQLGLPDEEVYAILARGVAAIEAEWARHGSAEDQRQLAHVLGRCVTAPWAPSELALEALVLEGVLGDGLRLRELGRVEALVGQAELLDLVPDDADVLVHFCILGLHFCM